MGRGPDPEDGRWFAERELDRLRTAHAEVRWLLDRGYRMEPAVELVGGHHGLSARQRAALRRSTASTEDCRRRASRRLPEEAAREGRISLDGFNQLIALEAALSGGVLLRGDDGVLRDMAGLRGSYRVVGTTDRAIDLLGEELARLRAPEAVFYLDSPVSDSGRLRGRIEERAIGWGFPVEAVLVPDADPCLRGADRIATADSALLDGCRSWIDLTSRIVAERVPGAWIVDFTS